MSLSFHRRHDITITVGESLKFIMSHYVICTLKSSATSKRMLQVPYIPRQQKTSQLHFCTAPLIQLKVEHKKAPSHQKLNITNKINSAKQKTATNN